MSNQYSATHHIKLVNLMTREGAWLPGIFFKYDVDALRVRKTEQERSWGHFFTRLFAVLGGTYVVLGLLYDVVDALVGKVRRRGKATAGDVQLPS